MLLTLASRHYTEPSMKRNQGEEERGSRVGDEVRACVCVCVWGGGGGGERLPHT